jgi:hypothetical protein
LARMPNHDVEKRRVQRLDHVDDVNFWGAHPNPMIAGGLSDLTWTSPPWHGRSRRDEWNPLLYSRGILTSPPLEALSWKDCNAM